MSVNNLTMHGHSHQIYCKDISNSVVSHSLRQKTAEQLRWWVKSRFNPNILHPGI